MPECVAIFIDGANLLHSLSKDFGRINIDFELIAQERAIIPSSPNM